MGTPWLTISLSSTELKKNKFMSFEILKPFGPSIVKTIIPEQIILDMNIFYLGLL